MKRVIYLLFATSLLGCADQSKRQKHLQSLYPNCKIEPGTGLIKQNGYDFIVIDSTNQIIAVDYYPFSETKIANLRNIR
jgi:hypothetical protein